MDRFKFSPNTKRILILLLGTHHEQSTHLQITMLPAVRPTFTWLMIMITLAYKNHNAERIFWTRHSLKLEYERERKEKLTTAIIFANYFRFFLRSILLR